MTDPEQRQILEMLDAGKISPDEALTLIKALQDGEQGDEEIEPDAQFEQEGEVVGVANVPTGLGQVLDLGEGTGFGSPAAGETTSDPQTKSSDKPQTDFFDPQLRDQMSQARQLWWVATAVGVLLSIGGAYGLYSALQNGSVNFWFFLALIPFFMGVLVLTLAVGNVGKRWLYVNVEENGKKKHKRVLLALPVSVLSWGLGFAGGLKGREGSGMIQRVVAALEDDNSAEGTLVVKIDNDDDERVTIFIA